jgi:hypothetical protein
MALHQFNFEKKLKKNKKKWKSLQVLNFPLKAEGRLVGLFATSRPAGDASTHKCEVLNVSGEQRRQIVRTKKVLCRGREKIKIY